MKFSFATTLLFLVLAACNGQTKVQNLNPTEFEKGIRRTGTQILDVRTPEEFSEKHIAGAKNININSKDFKQKIQGLDKTAPLYVYCLAGGRSKKAAEIAATEGFKEVYNLEYGINSWLGEGKETVTGSGTKVNAAGIGMSFDDYLNKIKANSKLVLVDFNAVWCGPCKILKPILSRVIKSNTEKVELMEIDVDKNATVANTMNVRGIPLLILYKQGKEVWRNMGVPEEQLINDKIKEFAD